jgi:hypothetical protein
MAILKHVHKLKKHSYKTGMTIFFCTLDCSYKIEAALAVGNKALCNICEEPFTLTELSVRLKRPHCLNCGRKVIKDENGKRKYVDKNSSDQVTASVRIDDLGDLRSRLDSVNKTVIKSNPFESKLEVETKDEIEYEVVHDEDL